MQNIALLGATGSIGRSALAVAALHPDRYRIHSIAGGSRVAELVEIARNVHPKHVVIADESKFRDLQEALSCAGLKDVEAHAGAAAVRALAEAPWGRRALRPPLLRPRPESASCSPIRRASSAAARFS